MTLTAEGARFIRSLEENPQFKNTVAGLLGYGKVLKRLNAIAEEQAKLASEAVKIWSEIEILKEGQARVSQEQLKICKEIK